MKTKHILGFLLLTFAAAAYAITAYDKETITLTPENSVAIVGGMNEDTTDKVITKLLAARPDKPFFIYLDSPGGAVFATFRLLNALETTPNVVCIANRAMSAAYLTLQNCPVRYVLKNSILMWHSVQTQAAGSTEDIINVVKVITQLQYIGDSLVSQRLGISLDELVKRKNPEYWTIGAENIIKSNQADDEVRVICSPELISNKEGGGCPL